MNSSCRQVRRSGFAMVVAVTLMALTGLAMALVIQGFATDAHRTLNDAADAQLRQLTIAGVYAAESLLGPASANQNSDLPLPASLQAEGASVHLQLQVAGDTATAQVRASLRKGARQVSASATWRRSGGKWQLDSVSLPP